MRGHSRISEGNGTKMAGKRGEVLLSMVVKEATVVVKHLT